MKKLILFFLLTTALHAQTATKITVTGFAAQWPAGTPTCGTGVTGACQSGYTLTITPPTGTAIVQQIPPGATTFTYVSPTILPYGTYALSMVTNGDTSAGVAGSSVATKSSSAYAPSITVIPAPGGMLVTFQ
jgi:hypothetical protein